MKFSCEKALLQNAILTACGADGLIIEVHNDPQEHHSRLRGTPSGGRGLRHRLPHRL